MHRPTLLAANTIRPVEASTNRWRRSWHWMLLASLLLALQALLLWLTWRHEETRMQAQTEQAARELTLEVTRALTLDLQRLQSLLWADHGVAQWRVDALDLLRQHPELLRVEWRAADFSTRAWMGTPYQAAQWRDVDDSFWQRTARQACTAANSLGTPAVSRSYFVPQAQGMGQEVIDLCAPLDASQERTPGGALVATVSLRAILDATAPPSLRHQYEISLLEADGARLARTGHVRGAGRYRALHVVNWPGLSLSLQVDSPATAPQWIPTLSTALVLGLTLALSATMGLLIKDMRRRARAEEISRQQQEKLQATARLTTVGEMASLLSHELNQPLAAIASYATGALNLLSTPHPDAETLQMIQHANARIAEQAQRAGRVIKSVHDFVRRRVHAVESVRVDELLEAVLPLIRMLARKSGAQIEVSHATPRARVRCDRTMLEQVLLNLTRNGLQAMDNDLIPLAKRILRLHTEPLTSAPKTIQFEIADQGPGIPDHVAGQLFTPFFTTKAEGMGLGLSLCRTVLEQHGGTLDYEITRDDQGAITGTVFRFTLDAPP